MVVHVVMQEAAGRPAIRLALEIAERAVVVLIDRTERPHLPGRRIDGHADRCPADRRPGHDEVPVGARARAAAVKRAVRGAPTGDRAASVVKLVTDRGGAVEVGRVHRGVALAVGEVRAREDRHVPVLPGVDGVRRLLRAKGAEVAEIGLVVVLVVVEAVVGVDLDALVVRVEDKVDHARDRVGAVHRGRAAGEHVGALDERRRDLVDVRGVGVAAGNTPCAAGTHALAVDEHQGALRAEGPQTEGRHTDRADGGAGVLFGANLRQGPQNIFSAHQARRLDVLRGHTGDRADGDLIRRLQQARTGDDDLLHGGRRLRGGCLGQRQRSR